MLRFLQAGGRWLRGARRRGRRSAARWAGGTLEALALIGVGIRRLSITPAAVGPIKEMVRKIDASEIEAAMAGWLRRPPADLRAELRSWANARGAIHD